MAKRRKKDQTSAQVNRDGALAVTFANSGKGGRQPLGDYAGLLAWGRRHGALTAEEAGRLERLAAEHPDAAAIAFSAAEDLRSHLSLILNARADHEDPPPAAVEALSDYLVHTVPSRGLVLWKGRIARDWAAGKEDDLDRPLWHVALSAEEVLTSGDYDRVTRCAADGCGLLFVARNPGSPRKWCQMKTCGHRTNSRHHYREKVRPYKAEIRRTMWDVLLRDVEHRRDDAESGTEA